jgi:peptidoglycan/xylan/chitin deacetylase (PgdA/CDA1 family)
MLNHRAVSFIFIPLMALLLGLHFYRELSLYFFFMALLAFVAIVVYGTVSISAGYHLKALCEGATTEKEIAITFDDGPNPEVTPQLLDLLKEKNIIAGFFCIGKNIEGNEDLLKRIDNEGHIIGNHSYSHGYMFDFFPAAWLVQDLTSAEQAITEVIGKKPLCFRPPYGVITPPLARAVRSLYYKVIGWSVRSMDTTIKDDEQILKNIKGSLAPGAILLFHDNNPRILNIIREFTDFAIERGYKIVGFDKLLGIRAYA